MPASAQSGHAASSPHLQAQSAATEPPRTPASQRTGDGHDGQDEEVYSLAELYPYSAKDDIVTPYDQISNTSELSILLDRAHSAGIVVPPNKVAAEDVAGPDAAVNKSALDSDG